MNRRRRNNAAFDFSPKNWRWCEGLGWGLGRSLGSGVNDSRGVGQGFAAFDKLEFDYWRWESMSDECLAGFLESVE